jgi:nitroimidazol reductase NimA-like FMN-containing flavoprotein (pyridoxamine 5'-phosphate oxidase superfamily)
MSTPTLRRADRRMDTDAALDFVRTSWSGRLATIGADGYPYCIPLLFVWMEDCIFLHGTNAPGHLRRNIDHEPRVCFELDAPGEVFDYGRFECDSGLAYRSAVIFGRIEVVTDSALKQAFCERLMEKYGRPGTDRPKGFFPRLDWIAVYRLRIERLSGKEQVMPAIEEQWPQVDRTKTPNAVAPVTSTALRNVSRRPA